MIRLTRPKMAPVSLIKAAPKATQELWQAWRDKKEIRIRKSLYGSAAVKAKLLKAQQNKCAYCETLFVRDYGQVEHYRPKSGWKQHHRDKLKQPGYFWLAYDWSNLCVSCAMCNVAGHKGNVFSLADPKRRAKPKKPSVAIESPLLLNPFDDDPEDHIAWNRDVPQAKCGSARGQCSITTFGLDNDDYLIDARRSYFSQIEAMLRAVESGKLSVADHTTFVSVLHQALSDAAPYAAMIRAAFRAQIMAL